MSCRGILRSLSDYLHGEAEKRICKQIEDHLTGCKKCRIHIDNMRMIIRLYEKWRDDRIPKDVVIRLRECIAKEAKRKKRKRS